MRKGTAATKDAYMSSSSFLNLDVRLIVFFLLCLPWTSFLSTHVVDGLKASPIILFLL